MPVKNAYHKALGYLSRTPKTIWQIKKYLTDKGYDAGIIEQVLAELLRFNYLDDKAFAQTFIENRVRCKPKSIFALGYELRSKGIDPVLANNLLADYEDVDLALKAVKIKKQAWNRLDESERKKKVMNFLRYRGFDYGVCQRAWQIFQTEF